MYFNISFFHFFYPIHLSYQSFPLIQVRTLVLEEKKILIYDKTWCCFYIFQVICLDVRMFDHITHKSLHLFASSFDWGTRENHGNVLSLVKIRIWVGWHIYSEILVSSQSWGPIQQTHKQRLLHYIYWFSLS